MTAFQINRQLNTTYFYIFELKHILITKFDILISILISFLVLNIFKTSIYINI